MSYEPTHLKRWTRPDCYVGAEWPEYFCFLGRNRDSDTLTESNYWSGLKAIGGEQTFEIPGGGEVDTVLRVQENHWAVGWVEWIAIHKTATVALRLADEVMEALEQYPVVDDEDHSEREEEEAARLWKDCYTVKDKVEMAAKERDYMRLDCPVWQFGRWSYDQLCASGGRDYPDPIYQVSSRLRDLLREGAR